MYIGRFKTNDKLTKLIQKKNPNWVIYRDPSVGLYAYNTKTEDEINLNYYSSRTIGSLEDFANEVDDMIKEFEERIQNE